MIYFENNYKGIAGFNNHLVPYTFCLSLSNFLDRDFFFDHEIPPSTPPEFATSGPLKEKFSILMDSPRAVVSDLVSMKERRKYEVSRDSPNVFRIDNPWLVCMSDEATIQRYGGTPIANYFSLGREVLIKERIQEYDLIEIGDKSLVNATFFFFLERSAKNELLASIRLNFVPDIESLSSKIISQLGRYHSVHLRLGDFARVYAVDGFRVDESLFRRYVETVFQADDLPIVVATDALEDKALLGQILPLDRCIFLDETIFDAFEEAFRALEFTDFSALTVLNMLVCAAGEIFVGTCRSTFTSVIHRLRQERWGKTDFNFFPDERVSRVLNDKMELTPDGHGFFEWNRYTPFSEHYEYPAWMREWNYDLTSI